MMGKWRKGGERKGGEGRENVMAALYALANVVWHMLSFLH